MFLKYGLLSAENSLLVRRRPLAAVTSRLHFVLRAGSWCVRAWMIAVPDKCADKSICRWSWSCGRAASKAVFDSIDMRCGNGEDFERAYGKL
jgi:hypothetical protein